MKERIYIRSMLKPKSREEALAAVRKMPQFEKDSTLAYEAVSAGNAAAVEILLAGGANIFGKFGADILIQRAKSKGFHDVVKVIRRHMGIDEAQSVRSFLKPKTEAEVLQKLETATQEQKDEALVDAAENGDAKAVQLLLDAGADVRADKGAPLRWAASSGRTEVVKLLLAAGADVHAKEEAALRWAADDCHIAVVKILLDAGADIESGIHYAKSWGMKVATHFLQEYIPTNESQSVRSLLKPKTDAEVLQKLQSATQEEKDAALIDAAKSGDAKAVELLLAAGADVNADNDEALRRAADRGRTEVVKVLLAAGADVHANDDYALRGAAYEGHIEVVELLLAAGADVHTIGGQALRLAAIKGHTRVVKLLKQYMGLTEAQSVLSLLRPKTEAEVLQKLDTATQEQKDEALTDAAASGDARGVQLLLAAGADVNADNGWGLSLAARWGHIEVVRLLLAAGADVHAREDMSLRYATERGRTEVVKLLQQHMKTL